MGTDSFTPDSGVLLAKTKNQDQAPFEWVVDANPQDIEMTDYVLPDGTKVPITIGDYRQLSDALFHAGTNSGSEYEYIDTANRLHFYITNVPPRSRRRAVVHGRDPLARRLRPAEARRPRACRPSAKPASSGVHHLQLPTHQHRQARHRRPSTPRTSRRT